MIFLVGLLACSATIVDIDETDLVYVMPGEYSGMSLDSNPTTGYEWVVVPIDSELFYIEDLGFVSDGTGFEGSGGIQLFIVYSSEECIEGDSVEITFSYVRAWETEPAEVKTITVQATYDKEKLDV